MVGPTSNPALHPPPISTHPVHLHPSGEPAIPSAPVCALGDAASDAAGARVSSTAVASHAAAGADDAAAALTAAEPRIVARDEVGLGAGSVK